MHVCSKFDGGKQINRSQGGSWEGRCAGAGLRQVLGPAWGPEAWKSATGCEANPVFRSTSEAKGKQVATDRKRKSSQAARERRRETKYRKTNDNSQQARRDYARHDSGQGVTETASDVPQEHLEKVMLDYYKTNVALTAEKAIEVERKTRNQGTANGDSGYWLAQRRKRITSSNTGVVAKRRTTTKVANLVKSLLYSKFTGSVATEWGKLQESAACEAYLEAQRSSSPGISVQSSGLVVHPEHHWLAASPDGLVSDPSCPDPEGIVKFKNPYKYREMTVRDAVKQGKNFCLTENGSSLIGLKHSHQYYYQIQATMFCTRRKWCDFVVRTTVDLYVERIAWDPQFWMSVLPRLHSFYFTAILPELTLPRIHTGGIREPAEWLKDPQAWKQQTETL